MKTSRVVLYGALLVCVAALGAWRVAEVRADKVAEQARAQREAQESQYKSYAATLTMQRPSEDLAMAQYLPDRYTRPASEWQAGEKIFHEKLLAHGKFDVLVLPFQVWGWAFDRSTRSLMAAELAAALAQAPGVKVADPYLVARALGEGQRRLNKDDIYRLADATGAKRIVMGYAGHDRKGKMSVAVLSHDNTGAERHAAGWGGRIASTRFDNIAFGDELPAIEAYQSMMPQLLKALGVEAAVSAIRPVEASLDLVALPPSPAGLTTADGNPARDAHGFLLYHLLTPRYLERTKERFAEKALLALSRLAPASSDYRVLRARTYMALGLRVAAIRVLGEPQTDEERGVLAALNGNLPEVRAMADRQKNPLKHLMQKIDENNIATAYGVVHQKQSLDAAAALKLPGNIWPYIVGRAFVDSDSWSQHDNASLKMLLDYELPVPGYSLEELVRGAAALGDRAKVQLAVDLSAFEHGRKFISADAARWCCDAAFNRPGQADYLELLQSMGHDNLIRRIRFLTAVQGQPDRAITYANSIDAVYKGNAYYAMERARAESKLAAQTSGAEKDGLLKASRENAVNAFYWEQGQSLVSNAAIMLFNADGGEHHGNFYHADIPFRPYYWTWVGFEQGQPSQERHVDALKNATWEIAAAAELDQSSPDEGRADRLLKSIDGRFLGSPYRNVMLSRVAMERGDTRAAEALYRENIRLSPDYWDSYEVLGKLLFAEGNIAEAARVFHAYPGFKKDASESRVAIANYAFEAGSYFYWSGHFDLAVPLYKISASQRTGASSEITSGIRLKLLAGDVVGAMAGTLDRAQRYRESYAYRDYLGMLHASGRSSDAWPAFGALVEEGRHPHIWETALVGHHMGALSQAQVVEWAKQKEFRQAGRAKNAAATYLLRFATTDRVPSKDLAEAIDSLDIQRWKVEGSPGLVSGSEGPAQQPGAKRQRVKSDLAYFAEAYRALKLKDHVAAKAGFDEAAAFYDLADESIYVPMTFYLPYYALAAAKAGDTSGIEKILARVKIPDQRFDYHLARAVLASASGKTEEALRGLELALYRRPHTERRPLLTQYTYGEIAEVVAELTGSPQAREMALDWARKNQKFEPWHSWAYAMEARLGTDPAARQRALAMAHYLDPQSERLSAFRKADIEAAVKASGRVNPFLLVAQRR